MPSAVTELLQFPVPDKKEMIDMKKLLLYLGVLILCTGSASPVIVYSPAATAAEKTAVQELAEHLKKITGKSVRCVKEGEKFKSSRPVYVGHTRFASSRVDLKNFGPEESLIRSYGKKLMITGGRPRGTLYGVYEFLERIGKSSGSMRKILTSPLIRS